ncbi:MAG: hypothetical protein ACK55I_24110, partial [bacterium]
MAGQLRTGGHRDVFTTGAPPNSHLTKKSEETRPAGHDQKEAAVVAAHATILLREYRSQATALQSHASAADKRPSSTSVRRTRLSPRDIAAKSPVLPPGEQGGRP